MNYDLDMPPYIQEMADWLDDERQVHPCHFGSAYQGFRNHDGLLPLGGQGGQVALPPPLPPQGRPRVGVL